MNGSKGNSLLAAIALLLSVGWIVGWIGGWIGGWLVDPGSWSLRVALLSPGAALAGMAAGLLWVGSRQKRRAVEHYFETLARHHLSALNSDAIPEETPPLLSDKGWSKTAARVREVLEEYSGRTRDLRHAQTARGVRDLRAAARSQRIEGILSGLTEPILAMDDYGDIVLANRSAERLFHFDLESAETRSLAELAHCQALVDLLTTTAHRKTPGMRSDEIEILDEDGNSQWYRATASLLTSASDPAESRGDTPAAPESPESHGAVAVLRNIGEQKALQKRNAEFVSAVSHEMKTPLAGIKAYVELLVDGDAEDEETREEFLEIINGQADRLQRLIDNMLNLARIEAGVVSVSKQTQSLNPLLDEAMLVVQPSAEAKQIRLVSELSPMYLGVLADRDMLLQAAINLLSNAIKYTPERGRVTLRSRLEDDKIRFEVQDTGVGLSEEDCGRVFEKFYRVKKNKDMAPGTGLGLPLAKHIVEDVHGGVLSVESTLGKGSTFAITLPNAGKLAGQPA